MSKKLYILLIIFGFSLLSVIHFKPMVASGQSSPPDIQMNVEPAYGGNFKYGEWLPLWITINNDGNDIDGIVQVDISQSGGNVSYAKEVTLPSGSRKKISLSVLPNNFSRDLEIKLYSNNKLVISTSFPVTPNQNDSILVGISSENRGALSAIENVATGDSLRKVVVFNLLIDQIPDTTNEMKSINVIVLNDVDTTALTNAQKISLEKWVGFGGHLIIGGGPGLEKTIIGLPEKIIKFNPKDTRQIDKLGKLELFTNSPILVSGPFTITTLETSGGSAIITEDNAPILHQWNVGNGKITVSALDLSNLPFNAWAGTSIFWENILNSQASFSNWMPRDMSLRQMRANSMTYPLSNLPALDIPSIKVLGILLIFYIMAIGPVNYFLLKRKNKLHLAWYSIPTMTAVFSVAAFGIAYSLRGNDIVINKLSIVNLGQNGSAVIDSYIGIFSPAQEAYEIEIDGDHLISPSFGGYYDPWNSSNFSSSNNTIFFQGDPSKVLGLDINQWSMQSFNVEAISEDLGKFDSNIQISDDMVTGTITNNLPFTIKDSVLIIGHEIIHIGDLLQNQIQEVNINLDSTIFNSLNNPLSYQILETAYPEARFQYQRDFETKRAILDNYFQPYGYWLGPNFYLNEPANNDDIFDNVFLIGWISESPPVVQIKGKVVTHNTLGLLVTQVPIQPAKGPFTIPATFLKGNIIEQPSSSGFCGGWNNQLYIDFGSVKYEFTLPLGLLETNLSQINIYFDEDISQWAQDDPLFALWVYNWDEDAWVQVPNLAKGINTIPSIKGFVRFDGIVQIKLDKDNRNSSGCVFVGMGFSGINE